jgi:hypothetical protein
LGTNTQKAVEMSAHCLVAFSSLGGDAGSQIGGGYLSVPAEMSARRKSFGLLLPEQRECRLACMGNNFYRRRQRAMTVP